MAARGCEVHSFDPTIESREAHESHNVPGVHFHYAGVRSNLKCDKSHTWTSGDGGGAERTVDSSVMAQLGKLRSDLGHGGRRIDVLKIDCEGCEWDVFYQLATTSPEALDGVRSIMIEIHVVKSLQMASAADLVKFEVVMKYLFDTLGFRVWYLHDNPGAQVDRAVHDDLLSLGMRPNQCCYELGLVRGPSETQPAILPAPAIWTSPVSPGEACTQLQRTVLDANILAFVETLAHPGSRYWLAGALRKEKVQSSNTRASVVCKTYVAQGALESRKTACGPRFCQRSVPWRELMLARAGITLNLIQ